MGESKDSLFLLSLCRTATLGTLGVRNTTMNGIADANSWSDCSVDEGRTEILETTATVTGRRDFHYLDWSRMEKTFVSEIVATGQEIHDVVACLEPVLADVSRPNVVIACLYVALSVMDPDITIEQLQLGVRETSRFICCFLEDVPDVAKEKMH